MLKERMKKYSFWTGLSAALVVLCGVIAKCFGFSLDNQLVEDIVMAVCGVLMALGVVCRPTKKEETETTQEDQEITQEETTIQEKSIDQQEPTQNNDKTTENNDKTTE